MESKTTKGKKKELLDEVKDWIKNEEKIAKEEFKKSAESVINKLKEIAKRLKKISSINN